MSEKRLDYNSSALELTARDLFALVMLHSLNAGNSGGEIDGSELYKTAVGMADELIEELNK